MNEFGKSVLRLLLKGAFYLSLLIGIFGCGMLFQFVTADRSEGIWREGAQSTFIWAIVIGIVGAIVTSYISSKLNSSTKQNNAKDETTPKATQ